MPKTESLEERRNKLQDALSRDDKNLADQFVTRLRVPDALQLVEECLENDEDPAKAIRRIILEYFERKNSDGVFLPLGRYQRQVLDNFSELTGQSVQSILSGLVVKHAQKELVEAKQALSDTKVAK